MTDPYDKVVFKALDRAVNNVVREHFDLYFDRARVDRVLAAWMKERLAIITKIEVDK